MYRYFHQLNNVLLRSHYDVLGISARATQNDIKSAYYKLSMIYHPDKNKDTPNAADKFRDITAAYEVLGNFKLRKLYDKGMIHTAEDSLKHNRQYDAEEDDAQTKFYKQHMRRTETPHASGRTPIYDFDEWSRNHYGKSFERRQAAKMKSNNKNKNEVIREATVAKHYFVMLVTVLFMLFLVVCYEEQKLDTVKEKPKPPM